ncbi:MULTISPECIES: DUF1156 domain-containing protein [Brucella]|uniref:DUF1156 domain-containing protein n=1 Tax=Brucella TaxID=234 RepID=UPI0033056CCE
MTTPYKNKLIEVTIPLDAINAASPREKSIRHGHRSTLHLRWVQRSRYVRGPLVDRELSSLKTAIQFHLPRLFERAEKLA